MARVAKAVMEEQERPKGQMSARVRLRRQHLVKVAMQLIQKRGFDAVSVNELAEHASISVGGLYRYIKTKTDLLTLICDDVNEHVIAGMENAVAGEVSYTGKLRAAITVYWDRVWEYSAAILVAYREFQNFSSDARKRHGKEEARIAKFFEDLIAAGVASGEFHPVDQELLSYQILLMCHMKVLKGWALRGREKDEVLEQNLELFLSRLRKQ